MARFVPRDDEPASWRDWPTSGDMAWCIGEHSDPHTGRLHDLVLEVAPSSPDYTRLMAVWAASGDIAIDWCGWCGEWQQRPTRRRRR
jgi:hypothetical protein